MGRTSATFVPRSHRLTPGNRMPTPNGPDKSQTPYHRVLLKLSGEAFCAPGSSGIEPNELALIAAEVKEAHQSSAQVAVVVGGGNFVRGAKFAKAAHIH